MASPRVGDGASGGGSGPAAPGSGPGAHRDQGGGGAVPHRGDQRVEGPSGHLPDELRSELRGLRTPGLVKRCAGFRDTPGRPVAQRCVRNSMRALARRIVFLKEEIKAHDGAIKALVDEAAPPSRGPARYRVCDRGDALHCPVPPRTLP